MVVDARTGTLYNPRMTYPTAAGDITAAKGKISSLRHVLRYLLPYRWGVVGASVALLFTSSAVLGMGAALRYLVDAGIAAGNLDLLDTYYWRLLLVVTLLAGATYLRYYLVSRVGEQVVADLRRDVYDKIVAMHTAFFETTRTGELLSRLTTDTTLLQNVVGSSISIFLRNSLLFVGGMCMLIITSLKLASYVVLLLPLVILPIIVIGRRVRLLSRETQNRVADISAKAEETLSAMRTIQAMALEDYESKRFAAQVDDAKRTALKRIRMRAALTAIVICLVFGAIITVLWIGGRDMIEGRITPGDLSAFIFYAVVVAGALGAVSEVIGELQRAAGATERLMELLALTPAVTAPPKPIQLPQPPAGRIAFDDVWFCYPSRLDTPALDRFSLHITPGETVAVVGPSGAGKTTVFQLLLRFYDPQSGRITLDGIDLRDLDPRALRRAIGLVPQDPVIFSASARDNILCDTQATDNAVEQAAAQAAALDFISALPQGLNTFLGEKGVRLSGGQKQRIAIARAILRDPAILLLDEATSALDSENERLVQQALEAAMQSRTTLVIAHRLATVLKADRIVVMDRGRIEAIGTHQQLLQTSPLYQRLAALQFDVKG